MKKYRGFKRINVRKTNQLFLLVGVTKMTLTDKMYRLPLFDASTDKKHTRRSSSPRFIVHYARIYTVT